MKCKNCGKIEELDEDGVELCDDCMLLVKEELINIEMNTENKKQ